MAYRIYPRDPVIAGNWYYVVLCEGCGKPIYLLDDPSKGKSQVSFAGNGDVTAPCRRCAHEGVYPTASLAPAEANETLPGAYPPRVKVSKSSRKPLAANFPKAFATFGVGYVEDRPAAAQIIARIITAWADIEVQCARLLAELMGTNIPATAAVFGSLRSGRAQHDALNAAAKTVLNEADYDLFSAHMVRRSSLEKERNDLAHGCFGVSVAIPDDVIWVSQTDFLTFDADRQHNPEAAKVFRSKQAVYELGTLERIAQEITEFHNQLGTYRGYLFARHDGPAKSAFRAHRYPQLCNQPHIGPALHRIRTEKKASQAPSPKPRGSRKSK